MFNSDHAGETALTNDLGQMVNSVATADINDAMEILNDPVALQKACQA